jgi:hypothetical protein
VTQGREDWIDSLFSRCGARFFADGDDFVIRRRVQRIEFHRSPLAVLHAVFVESINKDPI